MEALYGAFGLAILFFMSRGYEYSSYNNLINKQIKRGDVRRGSQSQKPHKMVWQVFLSYLSCVRYFFHSNTSCHLHSSFIPIDYREDNKVFDNQCN